MMRNDNLLRQLLLGASLLSMLGCAEFKEINPTIRYQPPVQAAACNLFVDCSLLRVEKIRTSQAEEITVDNQPRYMKLPTGGTEIIAGYSSSHDDHFERITKYAYKIKIAENLLTGHDYFLKSVVEGNMVHLELADVTDIAKLRQMLGDEALADGTRYYLKKVLEFKTLPSNPESSAIDFAAFSRGIEVSKPSVKLKPEHNLAEVTCSVKNNTGFTLNYVVLEYVFYNQQDKVIAREVYEAYNLREFLFNGKKILKPGVTTEIYFSIHAQDLDGWNGKVDILVVDAEALPQRK